MKDDKKIEGFRIDIQISTTTLDGHRVMDTLGVGQVFMKRPYFEDKFVKYEWFKNCLEEQILKRVEENYLRKFFAEEILEKYGEEK